MLVDTNVIIEAHRTRSWPALSGGWRVETVEACVAETQTGFQRRRQEDAIDIGELRDSLAAVHSVGVLEQAELALRKGSIALDEGEEALCQSAASASSASGKTNLCGAIREAQGRGVMPDVDHRAAQARGLPCRLRRLDPAKVARYSDAKLERLLENPGIIRNRLKVKSARRNAQAFLAVQEEWGSFSDYIWNFVDGRPIQNRWRSLAEVPASTALSDSISKDLRKRGFNFVGTTIVYAHMQATGMVNDHLVDCFRHEGCRLLGL